MPTSLVHLLARLDRWPRRLAALSCLLLAGASALGARRAAPGPAQVRAANVTVVVAAHDLGGGAVLTGRDLAAVSWPRDLVPAGASDRPNRLVGRRLAGPIRQREAVTATRLVGVGLTTGLAHGQVAVGVAIDAGLAAFVHPGDRVDILAGRPDDAASAAAPAKPGAAGATLIAEAVAVLAVLRGADAEASSGATLVLVAVERAIALRIAALDGRQVLAVVGGPP